ncbi:ACP S-malonyltransferase [Marinospirillum alkaliphilum]|uniref:Malonyl CoA-acyl carrier protein transacylase n=1 Tax=Marinospirillum alkaliphilum DSM 21637 TaxID=1122209 RepID=A0A1K1UGQ6_9GAMM|nr:ACP S-malonyltransferase [Marinospirillum alkaliphilum]SFX12008.1 [Acyl-carrier-protein] S-malonyltransferase [Marinospirillum alkaliphilum DSM 21637]
MASTLAFIFPGQGSQQIGMLAELAERYAVVRSTFEEASTALGYDLWQLVQEGPAEQLNRTDITQPAILAASVAVWRVWKELEGARPDWVAGHSLGEYSALVCSGAMDFADGLRLVRARGEFMQAAVPQGQGAMAAILGLEAAQIEQACAEAAQGEVVAAVNYNAPGQIVIAGSVKAVERAIAACQAAGAKKAMPLPVSVPSHCELMRPAAEKLANELNLIQLNRPRVPVVQNVHAAPETEVAAIRENLVAQLYRPVRWIESIEFMAAQGVDTYVECGPGKVLVGLNKRIVKSARSLAVNDPESVQAALELLRAE